MNGIYLVKNKKTLIHAVEIERSAQYEKQIIPFATKVFTAEFNNRHLHFEAQLDIRDNIAKIHMNTTDMNRLLVLNLENVSDVDDLLLLYENAKRHLNAMGLKQEIMLALDVVFYRTLTHRLIENNKANKEE